MFMGMMGYAVGIYGGSAGSSLPRLSWRGNRLTWRGNYLRWVGAS